LEDFAPGSETGVYSDSAIDPAMKNAFTQTRKWMMAKYSLTVYEAWTIITQAVNFGITQLVDGNWGIHAIIPKRIFEGVERNPACAASTETASGGFALSTTNALVASAALLIAGMLI
jgi:hypothetical protein